MTAEPWLHEIKHRITQAISFGCDYCATTRRKRAIAFSKEVETGSRVRKRVCGGRWILRRSRYRHVEGQDIYLPKAATPVRICLENDSVSQLRGDAIGQVVCVGRTANLAAGRSRSLG
jgi:hypothetical protein